MKTSTQLKVLIRNLSKKSNNDFIAHRSINNIMPAPYLDIALNVTLKHDEWIRKIIEPDILDSPKLI